MYLDSFACFYDILGSGCDGLFGVWEREWDHINLLPPYFKRASFLQEWNRMDKFLVNLQRNIPSHSQARQHDNNIDLTSPQFNTPSSRAQVIKPDKRKNNRIDLTSPKHVSKEGLKKKPVRDIWCVPNSISVAKLHISYVHIDEWKE